MIVQVCIHAGKLLVVDTSTDARSTAEAITRVMQRSDVAAHLHDLRFSGLRAEAKIVQREEVAA